MSIKPKKIAVIGGGPAGFMAAISVAENSKFNSEILIFEKNVPLNTILRTGNGRCNLANALYDYKHLPVYYLRGEKFLYSVFKQFGTTETLDWFNSKGLQTYVQPDRRIFPASNKASSVRELLLKESSNYGIIIKKRLVKGIGVKDSGFEIIYEDGSYNANSVIVSTGGNSKRQSEGYSIAEGFYHYVTELRPALTALITKEKLGDELSGISIKNSRINAYFNNKKVCEVSGDFVFTHTGISGPAVFNLSSYCAYVNYSSSNPLILKINFCPSYTTEIIDNKILNEIKLEPNKAIVNMVKKYIPKNLALYLLNFHKINPVKKVSELLTSERKKILELLTQTNLNVTGWEEQGEIVTAGGVCLKEINSKTLESKFIQGLYFCGEVLDIDGLTGGFNLQACWSTGFIAGKNAVAGI